MRHTLFIFLFVGICAEASAIEVPDTCPPKPVDEESAIALANTWFKKGQKHVEDKEYQAAVDAFACSNSIIEHQNTLYNAFKSALLAKKDDVAVELGNMVLALSTDEKTKKEVQNLLASLPPVQREPIKEEEPERPAPVVAKRIAPVEDPIAPTPETMSGRSALWKTGVVVSVLGGAALAAGGVLQAMAASAQQTTSETRDYGKYLEAKQDIDTFQKVAIASFVASGVFFGAGIVLFLVDGKSKEAPSLAVVPSGNGLVLRGTF
ncbi:MAG: hypothetical protein MUC50_09775 [Myxococcota bacterium]|nr:hypothetical protein [Myxococcota bacterium]